MRALGRVIALISLAACFLALLGCPEIFPKRTEGEKLFRKRCAECHGIDGAGNTPRYMGNAYADLTDDGWKRGGDKYSLEVTIREGIFGSMPGNEDLTGAQIRAIIEHLKTLRD
jgi:mono/diheme cytochrome c family protein